MNRSSRKLVKAAAAGAFADLAATVRTSDEISDVDESSDFEVSSVLERRAPPSRSTRYKPPRPVKPDADETRCIDVAICGRAWGECTIVLHEDRRELGVQAVVRSQSRLAMPKTPADLKTEYVPFGDMRAIRVLDAKLLVVLDLPATSRLCIGNDDNHIVLMFADDLGYLLVRGSLERQLGRQSHPIAAEDVPGYLGHFHRKGPATRHGKRKSLFDPAPTERATRPAPALDFLDNKDALSSFGTNATIEIHEPGSPAGRGVGSRTRSELKKRDDGKTQAAKDRVVVRYPLQSHSKSRIVLTEGDIDRLQPGEFLNDNLIDFFFKCVLPRPDGQGGESDDAFLLNALYSEVAKVEDGSFAKVNRWTRATPLFEKRFLFVPINDNCHWSLAVICHPSGLIKTKPQPVVLDVDDDDDDEIVAESQDPETAAAPAKMDVGQAVPSEPSNVPCILYFDSLKCHNKTKITANLRRYRRPFANESSACTSFRRFLESEYASRFPNDPNTVFDASDAVFVEPEVPRQSNSCDCGVYLLLYALQVLQQFPDGIFLKHVAAACDPQLTPTMFDTDAVTEHRDYMHQVLLSLSAFQHRRIHDSSAQLAREGLTLFTDPTPQKKHNEYVV
ncbi:hypothetical protein SPRG_01310 [Saprolegnia parasitica CBS 223.65]|uniref:Ubiquitin-like protease family profile domain-containing protein n=1 Tax=Saprolegnia parasitica (strain CBS 223.65) TaxID=695850 RepID=A0A067D5Q3_SAPPC|nr:hypothetical protein SPRG_01310 [Saprolegnia parasitica CBS 223.65]KDO34036.1 hypothetical protein SPRG_01310 [Saprolegnia parasitica CBS 223.65]|eukprot:XP_012194921.1 hypothetical protein SPRG_01310 [Saprolegnia parasitica CBS 223.65]